MFEDEPRDANVMVLDLIMPYNSIRISSKKKLCETRFSSEINSQTQTS